MTDALRSAFLLLGLTYLLTQSSIFAPLRIAIRLRNPFLAQMVYCPACSGFWIGATLSLLGLNLLPTNTLLDPLYNAVMSCGLMATWNYVVVTRSSWETDLGLEEV